MFASSIELGITVDVVNSCHMMRDEGKDLFTGLHVYFVLLAPVEMLKVDNNSLETDTGAMTSEVFGI